MFYHASPVKGLKLLTPHVSNHGRPLVYMSSKRENVLVYLSNAVEKFCREAGLVYSGAYYKWASYGFNSDGILVLEEYYLNATADTYKGVSGFIYTADKLENYTNQADIPFAVISESPVKVTGCEEVPDAYDAIMDAAENGSIIVKSFEQNSKDKLLWIKRIVSAEYEKAKAHPEYRAFLRAKFPFCAQ